MEKIMNFKINYKIDKYGVITQKNPSAFDYDQNYLNSYRKIKEKCILLSNIRLEYLKQRTEEVFSLLDFGSGTGEFLEEANKQIENVYSYDLIQKDFDFATTLTIDEVNSKRFDVVCFFDSLEHTTSPRDVIKTIDTKYIFISVPWCYYETKGEKWFMDWKHRKPDEHLHHFNEKSLSEFMKSCGYETIDVSNIEDVIRIRYDKELPNILSGIFKKYE
jgi:SAM-dependent methyltransferase